LETTGTLASERIDPVQKTLTNGTIRTQLQEIRALLLKSDS
jgi:hypothetical protein